MPDVREPYPIKPVWPTKPSKPSGKNDAPEPPEDEGRRKKERDRDDPGEQPIIDDYA